MLRRLVIGCCTLSVGAVWALRAPDHSLDYPGTVESVHSRLATMPMPAQLAGQMNGDSERIRTDSSDPYEVRWSFEVEGRSIGQVTAYLSAVDDDTTNVRVDFEPGNALPSNSAPYAVAKQPLIASVAESYVAEQIGATLEGRAFDESKVAMQVATYIGSHPAETQAYVESVEAMLDENSDASIESAMGGGSYRPQPRPGQPMKSAAPMTDLSQYR